ncbi:MAG TPA: alpha/beta fold hydrolase [Acidimicrobiales bacterium]
MTADVLSGAEAFSHQGGSSGVLVVHGFTGNPSSMRPLAERAAGAGYSVELPRLPGHGTTIEDMQTTTWADWAGAAESAYLDLAKRCEKVALVGLSMGGSLCAYLAERHAEVAGAVLINPLVKPPVAELLEGLDALLEAGVDSFESIGSDIKKEGVVELSYDATPLVPAKSLFEGVARVHENLSRIESPILLLSSREDHVVTSDNGDDVVEMVSGPLERFWLEDSYHVATLDNDQALIESLTLDFLAKVL